MRTSQIQLLLLDDCSIIVYIYTIIFFYFAIIDLCNQQRRATMNPSPRARYQHMRPLNPLHRGDLACCAYVYIRTLVIPLCRIDSYNCVTPPL